MNILAEITETIGKKHYIQCIFSPDEFEDLDYEITYKGDLRKKLNLFLRNSNYGSLFVASSNATMNFLKSSVRSLTRWIVLSCDFESDENPPGLAFFDVAANGDIMDVEIS